MTPRRILLAAPAVALCMTLSSAFVPSISSRPFGAPPTRLPTPLFARRDGGGRGQPRVKENRPPMNEEVPDGDLRVTMPSAKGKDEPLGVLSKQDALRKAKELGGLDLVLVNPQSDPPVCKIVDYSKYRYMQEKKAKEVKKNSKASEVKEVKMSYKIDVHDYDVRKKSALKFLQQGNRVKCTVMFRGREVQHDKLGFDLLEKLATDLEDACLRENKPKREGRNLSVIIGPRPELLKTINENRRAEDKAKKQRKEQERENKAKQTVQAEEALAVTTATVTATAAQVRNTLDNLEDGLDFSDDSESSLDALFGKDDLTDDLFG